MATARRQLLRAGIPVLALVVLPLLLLNLTRMAVASDKLRPQGSPPDPMSTLPGTWRSPIVAVVASVDGTFAEAQEDVGLTFYVYQRVNTTSPRYSANIGLEGGVFFQFVADHYDSLPE